MTSTEEFSNLTHEEQVARIQPLAEAALREFGVSPTAMSPLAHAENTTFKVESDQGRFCLRVCRPGYQSDANVQSEIAFMSALRAHGISAPQPYQERAVKASVPEVPEPRNCVLLSWQPGEFRRGGYLPHDAEKLGRLMAQMHEFTVSWDPPPGFDRQIIHEWAWKPRPEMAIDRPNAMISEEDRALLLAVNAEARNLLASLPRDKANFGLIHSDMHQGNVLFEGDEVHLIDFDDTGWGFWMYDFAAALAYAVTKPHYSEVKAALLRGYASMRPLPPDAERHLNAFIRLRLGGICNWIFERHDNPKMRETGPDFIRGLCAGIRAASN